MDYLLLQLSNFTPISIAFRIILAALFGGLIGIERSKTGHNAGLRTHIFISLGSAMTAMIGLYVTNYINSDLDSMRIAAQVVSGIGFLGVGTILVKNSSKVTGLTTAAGMWATATIGLAVGFGFYEGAVICTAVCFLTAAVLAILEKNRKDASQFYVEIVGPENVNTVINNAREKYSLQDIFTVSAKSNMPGHIGAIMTVSLNGTMKQEVIDDFLSFENVIMVVEE